MKLEFPKLTHMKNLGVQNAEKKTLHSRTKSKNIARIT